MTGSHDNYLMFRVGQIHAMVKQMHGVICASPPVPPPSKSLFSKDTLIEFGRMVIRGVMPILTPYIIAFLTGLGAMIVTVWKAFTRGWLAF